MAMVTEEVRGVGAARALAAAMVAVRAMATAVVMAAAMYGCADGNGVGECSGGSILDNDDWSPGRGTALVTAVVTL